MDTNIDPSPRYMSGGSKAASREVLPCLERKRSEASI